MRPPAHRPTPPPTPPPPPPTPPHAPPAPPQEASDLTFAFPTPTSSPRERNPLNPLRSPLFLFLTPQVWAPDPFSPFIFSSPLDGRDHPPFLPCLPNDFLLRPDPGFSRPRKILRLCFPLSFPTFFLSFFVAFSFRPRILFEFPDGGVYAKVRGF